MSSGRKEGGEGRQKGLPKGSRGGFIGSRRRSEPLGEVVTARGDRGSRWRRSWARRREQLGDGTGQSRRRLEWLDDEGASWVAEATEGESSGARGGMVACEQLGGAHGRGTGKKKGARGVDGS